MIKEQGFLQQSPLETKPCTVVFKNGRKLAIVGLVQLLISLVVVGFGVGSFFLWKKPHCDACHNWRPDDNYRITDGIQVIFHYTTNDDNLSTEALTTPSPTMFTAEQNELMAFLIVQKTTINYQLLQTYHQLQEVEDLLMDRIPELNQPDWMKYLKPYILQKYETSVNQLDADWQNDPAAAVILETSEEDYVGSGEEQGSGYVDKRQLRNYAYQLEYPDKINEISEIVSRAIQEEENEESGSGSEDNEYEGAKSLSYSNSYHNDYPIFCRIGTHENNRIALVLVVITLCSVSFPVIAALFGLVAGCTLNKKHKKNLSVLQPPLPKGASISYIVLSTFATLSDLYLITIGAIFLHEVLFKLSPEEGPAKFVLSIAFWIFLLFGFLVNLTVVVYGMMCSCCFDSVDFVRKCSAENGHDQKRAKSTFSMSFSNKVKYNSSGVQRLDLDIQFGQGSISLRSTTVWNRQSSRTSGTAYQVPNSFMDATLRINTQLTSNEKFCKNVMSFHSCPPYMQESNPVFTDWSLFQNQETLPAPEDEEIILGKTHTPKSQLEEIPPFPLDESIQDDPPKDENMTVISQE